MLQQCLHGVDFLSKLCVRGRAKGRGSICTACACVQGGQKGQLRLFWLVGESITDASLDELQYL